MKKSSEFLSILLFFVFVFAGQAWAGLPDYTVSNADQLFSLAERIYESTPDEARHGAYLINGRKVEWFSKNKHGQDVVSCYVDEKYLGDLNKPLKNSSAERNMVRRIAGELGLSPGRTVISPITSAGTKTSEVVFDKVIMPVVKTRAAKDKEAAQKALQQTRTFGARLRYADIDNDGADGNLLGFNIGLAHDFNENFTIGAIFPYEHLNVDDVFEANRYSMIVFAQYIHDISPDLSAALIGNLNYTYTDLDYDFGGDNNINTYGGGISAALTLDKDVYSASVAASYQYSKEDIDWSDDYQHLLKLGVNAGYRIGQNFVITLFGVWNKDVTDYSFNSYDDDSFDVGTELTMGFSDSFGLTIGYKKLLGLDGFDSDEIYIGSIFRF